MAAHIVLLAEALAADLNAAVAANQFVTPFTASKTWRPWGKLEQLVKSGPVCRIVPFGAAGTTLARKLVNWEHSLRLCFQASVTETVTEDLLAEVGEQVLDRYHPGFRIGQAVVPEPGQFVPLFNPDDLLSHDVFTMVIALPLQLAR